MPAIPPRPVDAPPATRPPATRPPAARAPATRPPAATARPRRRRPHRLRRALIGLVVVVVLLAAGVIGLGAYAWGKVGRIQAFPTTRVAAGAGTTYLLIGSDSRAGLTRAQQDALGTGSDAGARTDSIMIVDVPSDGSKPAIISIPRDSYVAIPGYGHNKINAAFAFGGAPLLVQTIETDTGLHIDHVVEIGFGGFAGLVDDLDGVRICSKTAVDDADAHIDIKAGCQVMSGKTALGYVRARHFDPLGDLGRVQRQRQVLAAIVAKATSAQTLLHPGRLWSLASDGGATLSVDDQMHSWNALALARAVRDVSSGDGVTTTVPIADPDATTSAGSSVLWNNGEAATLFRALQAGHGVPAALISGSGLGAS
jgi:LCP family protein required for cell wall assembly